MEQIVKMQKSVIVAADVTEAKKLYDLAFAVSEVPGIGAFKFGIGLGLSDLLAMVKLVRNRLGDDFPIIYDHQKAGNDIPDMGKVFASQLKKAGVNAAILFPFAGPATQEAWTKACFDVGLQVLTGGIMTHAKFLMSEGGYISDDAPERIYRLACDLGMKHFVVPGNKLAWVKMIRELLTGLLGEGNFTLYAPGFITQGGDLSECGQIAGDSWHAIVGSAIYGKDTIDEMRKAAITATKLVV